MEGRERSDFIRSKLEGCDAVIFIKKEDWGTTIGELTNQMLSTAARYHEPGRDILKTISKGEREDNLPIVTTWHGAVNGHWEPLCATIVFPKNSLVFSTYGFYYDYL